MPYGWLSPEMEAAIAVVVQGQIVWDFGAGDHVYAERLIEFGASGVRAVDKERFFRSNNPRITTQHCYFHEVCPPESIDVAFLSWPQNNVLTGLVPLLQVARTVIYLGKNSDGTACGNAVLYRHLSARTVLRHIPHRQNVFVVYGDSLPEGTHRAYLGEELVGIFGLWATFDEAESLAARTQGLKDVPR